MNIKIRQASIGDLDEVTKVEASCFSEAEADGKIIGFINGCVINETVIYDELYKDSTLHIPNGAYQTIFGLDVISEYRNQGIAAQLMNYIIEVSRVAGRKGVVLTCKEKLIDYYTKFGYKNKGISKSVHGGVQWYDMILEF